MVDVVTNYALLAINCEEPGQIVDNDEMGREYVRVSNVFVARTSSWDGLDDCANLGLAQQTSLR